MKVNMNFFLTFVFGLLPSLGMADNVVVLSGDHEAFSRIVLHLPKRANWTLEGSKRFKELILSGREIEWDMSKVFSRISRKRVMDIKPLERSVGLTLDLNCDCEVDVSWYGVSMLVLDVKDPVLQNQNIIQDQAYGSRNGLARHPKIPDVNGSDEEYDFFSPRAVSVEVMKEVLNALPKIKSDKSSKVWADEDIPRGTIMTALNRAASLGLLEGQRYSENVAGDFQEPLAKRVVVSADDQVNRGLSSILENMTSYTTADAVLDISNHANEHSVGDSACISDDLVSIQKWGGEQSFSNQMGSARRKLGGQDRSSNREERLRLLRLYLYFGFGAEARQIVNDMGLPDLEASLYVAISRLVDGNAPETSILDWQAGCDGAVAILSVLSTRENQLHNGVNVDSIIRSLSNFPNHLRKMFATRLAEQFRHRDEIELAERFSRFDGTSSGSGESQFSRESTGQDLTTEPGLTWLSIASSNSDTYMQDILKSIEDRLNDNSNVPFEWVELVGSYAQEQRKSEIGAVIAHRYVRSLAASGQYGRAFYEASKLSNDLDGNALDITEDKIVSYTVRNADDVTFVKLMAYRDDGNDMNISSLNENEVARRLLALGFPSEALHYLSEDADGTNHDARRLLRAKASLAIAKPDEAIELLHGMNGVEVERLRAEANARLDNHMSASLLYRVSGDDDAALRQALQAKDWEGAATLADSDPAKVMEMPEQKNEVGGSSASLNDGAHLIAESTAIRGDIAQLLKVSKNQSPD